MNRLMIKLIRKYQQATINSRKTCRFTPTCSEYAIDAYNNYNFFSATFLMIFRILRCNPLCKGGYDPIPKFKDKKLKKWL